MQMDGSEIAQAVADGDRPPGRGRDTRALSLSEWRSKRRMRRAPGGT